MRDIFLINDPNGDHDTNAIIQNLECNSENNFFRSQNTTSCIFCPVSKKWDTMNFYCGTIDQYWVGSEENGFCVDCNEQHHMTNSISPTCYCECTAGYDEVVDIDGSRRCMNLESVQCPTCLISSTSIRQLLSEDKADCGSGESYCRPVVTGKCYVSYFGYESVSNGVADTFYGINRGCSENIGGALAPKDRSLLATRNGTISQRIIHYYANDNSDVNSIITVSMVNDAIKVNTLQTPLLCYKCKSNWSRTVENECVTPNRLDTATAFCPTGNCQSITFSIHLAVGDDPIYYADRGCTEKPETFPPPNVDVERVDIKELDELADIPYTGTDGYDKLI